MVDLIGLCNICLLPGSKLESELATSGGVFNGASMTEKMKKQKRTNKAKQKIIW